MIFLAYTAFFTVILNLVFVVVLTPVFKSMTAGRAVIDETGVVEDLAGPVIAHERERLTGGHPPHQMARDLDATGPGQDLAAEVQDVGGVLG